MRSISPLHLQDRSITHRLEATLASVNHCGESGRNVPPRPAPTAHFYFPAWRNRRRRRHATRPAPAARSAVRRYTRPPATSLLPVPGLQCSVLPTQDSVSAVKVQPLGSTALCNARPRALSQEASQSEVAQAPGNRRALQRVPTPWSTPARTSHLPLPLGKNTLLVRLNEYLYVVYPRRTSYFRSV